MPDNNEIQNHNKAMTIKIQGLQVGLPKVDLDTIGQQKPEPSTKPGSKYT